MGSRTRRSVRVLAGTVVLATASVTADGVGVVAGVAAGVAASALDLAGAGDGV